MSRITNATEYLKALNLLKEYKQTRSFVTIQNHIKILKKEINIYEEREYSKVIKELQ